MGLTELKLRPSRIQVTGLQGLAHSFIYHLFKNYEAPAVTMCTCGKLVECKLQAAMGARGQGQGQGLHPLCSLLGP